MKIVVKIFEFSLFLFVASFLFLYKNHKCVVLQPEIEKQYGRLLTLINQSAQGLIQGGIAYAQESSAQDGLGGTVKHARVASKLGYNMGMQSKDVRVKKRWLTFEEVRQYYKINPQDVCELRKKWPYAQIVSRSNGTRLVWISQGVILPSSKKNTKKLKQPNPYEVTSHRHKKTLRKEEKHLVNISYAAHIDLESSQDTDELLKRENWIERMVIDEKKEKGMMHMVVTGESLSGIAQRYDIEWQDIYQINRKIIGDNPHLIEPGQLLHIPSTVYVVKKGDSLSKISKRLGIAWQKIYDLNKKVIGDNPHLIEPGQKFTFSPQAYVADSRHPFTFRTSAPLKCVSIQDSREFERAENFDVPSPKNSLNDDHYPVLGNIESLWHGNVYSNEKDFQL